ncbi:MAG: polyphosphate polymerase domain-containing protein [Crocinitomicaceae bacterium]|nr:polyphosphate polymerase domain-containing protein [Crocinitomicaceae bacterium]
MDRVVLMDRTDTKFMLSVSKLQYILPLLPGDYYILDINGIRQSRYETLYYDSPDFIFYQRHHSGKKNRLKIRKRSYIDSNLTFLEVKFKSNKDRTIKNRIQLSAIYEALDQQSHDFIRSKSAFCENLVPTVWNTFTRITLVSKSFSERITIDIDLVFRNHSVTVGLPNVAIIEVKQSRFSRNSPIMSILKKSMVRPEGISKYCLGVALLKKNIKINAFKTKLKKIKKIEDGMAA